MQEKINKNQLNIQINNTIMKTTVSILNSLKRLEIIQSPKGDFELIINEHTIINMIPDEKYLMEYFDIYPNNATNGCLHLIEDLAGSILSIFNLLKENEHMPLKKANIGLKGFISNTNSVQPVNVHEDLFVSDDDMFDDKGEFLPDDESTVNKLIIV